MTYSVYQHWDPLKVCVVGRSYPPDFYEWIKVPHVRGLFEKIAIETEEDYQAIIKKLEEFGVTVLRPDLHPEPIKNGKILPPPMVPRDYTCMIGTKFYQGYYVDSHPDVAEKTLGSIVNHVRSQGNEIVDFFKQTNLINGAMVSRIGKDLYFGTNNHTPKVGDYQQILEEEFPDNRIHIVNTSGHSDGTYCPVCPGLIISLNDVPTYADTFPGWEVVYLPGQSWAAVDPFLHLKHKNKGKWWIPGFEYDQDVINTVETWLNDWVGYVEETVFDVNMLVIDPKNVLVFNYNDKVFDALTRHGVTPHIVPFRHRYFWDGGIHCITSDLHREGTMQDYFPERKIV